MKHDPISVVFTWFLHGFHMVFTWFLHKQLWFSHMTFRNTTVSLISPTLYIADIYFTFVFVYMLHLYMYTRIRKLFSFPDNDWPWTGPLNEAGFLSLLGFHLQDTCVWVYVTCVYADMSHMCMYMYNTYVYAYVYDMCVCLSV